MLEPEPLDESDLVALDEQEAEADGDEKLLTAILDFILAARPDIDVAVADSGILYTFLSVSNYADSPSLGLMVPGVRRASGAFSSRPHHDHTSRYVGEESGTKLTHDNYT